MNNRLKRFFRVFFPGMAAVLLCVMTCISSTALAADGKTPIIYVESVEALPGENADVKLCIENNPGILGAKLTLTYDAGLTLVRAGNGEAFSALSMTKAGKFTSPCSFTWDGQEIEDGDIRDGVILHLTFQVDDAVEPGAELSVKVSYTPNGIVDNDLHPIAVQIENGAVLTAFPQPDLTAEILSASCRDGIVTCRIDCSDMLENVTAVVSAYTDNGQMCGVRTQSLSLQKGSHAYEFRCDLGGDRRTLFLMGSDFAPLCAAESVAAMEIYTVTFVDWDGTVLSTQSVLAGENAVPPPEPVRPGYVFIGWSGSSAQVTSDCTVTAQYEEDTTPALYVSSVSAKAGDSSVMVTVSVAHNPGILGMMFDLTYDDSVLTLKSSANGEAVCDVLTLTKPKNNVSGCRFVWDGVEIGPEDIHDGTVLTLYFDVAENAPIGSYSVGITYSSLTAVDNSLRPITLSITDGSIHIVK